MEKIRIATEEAINQASKQEEPPIPAKTDSINSVTTIDEQLVALDAQTQLQDSKIANTLSEIGDLRAKLGIPPVSSGVTPSIRIHEEKKAEIEQRRVELETKLSKILQSDVSEKYMDLINKVKQSKIDWINSDELVRRLKLKGATDEEIHTIKDQLSKRALDLKAVVLPNNKFDELLGVISEMANDQEVKSGEGLYVPEDEQSVPEYLRGSTILQESIAPPPLPLPGRETPVPQHNQNPTVNPNLISHELGHATEGEILKNGLYKDWQAPTPKSTAPDPEYIGSWGETNVRIQALLRDIRDVFDPTKERFEQKHLEVLKRRLKTLEVSRDTKDLLKHYQDDDLIKLINEMPAV